MAKISEEELEQYIFDNFIEIFRRPNEFRPEGSKEPEIEYPLEIMRQVHLGNYGRIDLMVIYHGELLIIELKEGPIDHNALAQLSRYITGMRVLLDDHPMLVNGLLIGKEVATGGVSYVLNQTRDIDCWTYELDLAEGIQFIKDQGEGWVISDGGIEDKKYQDLVAEIISLNEKPNGKIKNS